MTDVEREAGDEHGPRPRVRGRRRIAFALVAMLLPLLLAEGLAQVLYHPKYIYLDDAEGLGFRFRPHAVLKEGMRLNDRGFHDADRAIEKPPGVYRIVALGDSFTFGYTDRAHTIPALIEARLKAGGRALEVHNLGVLAYGTGEQSVLLEREGLPRKPDLVLLFFYVGNDVRDNARPSHRRVVKGKLLRAKHATWRRALLRSFALYRIADDGILFPPRSLADELAERATRRAPRIAALSGGEQAAALAREIVVDTELVDQIPAAAWLPRVKARVAEAEARARAEKDPAAFLRQLEARAKEERRGVVLNRAWIQTHVRFAPMYLPREREDEIHTKGWAETERLLAKVRDACRAAGAELRVVVLPCEVQVDMWAQAEMVRESEIPAAEFVWDAPQRRLATLLPKLGIPYLDVLPACIAADRKTRLFYKSNTHFNDVGNAVVAEQVAAWLSKG